MLTPADTELARRDPALPGLPAVLDREGINYVRYKPGTNCLVGGAFGYAKTYRGNPAVMEVQFPDDAGLDLTQRAHVLEKMLPQRPDLWPGTLTTLSYKPERRYVARLDVGHEPQAVVKFYDETDFERAYTNSKHFQPRPAPRLGRSRRHRALVSEWVPGRLLAESLEPSHVARAGAALAEMHTQPVGPLTQWPGTDNLRELAEMLALLCPALATRAERLAAELSVTVETKCVIHGDFYAKQVVVKDRGVVLLDLDRAAVGEPAVDLGNFLAHLERDGLPVEAARAALLEGYGAAPARVDLFTALGLFRLAHEPFRRREPDWPERIATILERAETALHRSRIGRVVREKPGRRRLVEYETAEEILLGKIREKGLDKESYRVQRELWEAGLPVPEPVAAVPGLKMWLQRKVPGTPATELLAGPRGLELARRIAEVIHAVHRAGVPAKKQHTMADELRILHERLGGKSERIERVLAACDQLGRETPAPVACPIHRDCYADHVLVDGDRLWLVDFDLYCEGDPGLDVGNFVAHMTEHSLRIFGDPSALADREQALAERFIELAGESTRAAVRAYVVLTLVRHIHISTLFPERRAFTERLVELCEQRLKL